VNGRFNAGAYVGNLVKAATPPPPPNPYAGAADRIRAAANEIEDEKKIGYRDPELPPPPPPKIIPYTSGSLMPTTSTPPRRLYGPPPPFGPPYPYRGPWYDTSTHTWRESNKGLMDIIGTPQLGQIPRISLPASEKNLCQLLEKLPDFSVSVGGHLSGGIALYGDAGVYLASMDSHGHASFFQGFLGAGATAIGFVEATPIVLITDSPVDKLPGTSVNAGGSIEDGGSIGGDIVLFSDPVTKQIYKGLQLSVPGLGWAPASPLIPLEFHGGASHTFNPLFEVDFCP